MTLSKNLRGLVSGNTSSYDLIGTLFEQERFVPEISTLAALLGIDPESSASLVFKDLDFQARKGDLLRYFWHPSFHEFQYQILEATRSTLLIEVWHLVLRRDIVKQSDQ
ncbi:hypothetical protein Tco_0546511 [Tanacetum coccineum]